MVKYFPLDDINISYIRILVNFYFRRYTSKSFFEKNGETFVSPSVIGDYSPMYL